MNKFYMADIYISKQDINWASVSEPHLIMLMCEPHTVLSQVVPID